MCLDTFEQGGPNPSKNRGWLTVVFFPPSDSTFAFCELWTHGASHAQLFARRGGHAFPWLWRRAVAGAFLEVKGLSGVGSACDKFQPPVSERLCAWDARERLNRDSRFEGLLRRRVDDFRQSVWLHAWNVTRLARQMPEPSWTTALESND